MDYFFEFDPHSLVQKAAVSVAVCILIHLAHALTVKRLSAIAKQLGAPADRQAKFAGQVINLIFHAISGAYTWNVISKAGWLEDTSLVWENYANQANDPLVVLFYSMENGYHLQRLVSLLLKPRHADFLEMFVHHAATMYLLSVSTTYGYVRIGILVLWVHDVSDVLGCAIKLVTYCQMKWASIALFPFMAGCWFYMRLNVMVRTIIPIAVQVPAKNTIVWIAIGFLCVLTVLNFYWFTLFLNMLRVAIVTKARVVDDLQEFSHAADHVAEAHDDDDKHRRKHSSSPPSTAVGKAKSA